MRRLWPWFNTTPWASTTIGHDHRVTGDPAHRLRWDGLPVERLGHRVLMRAVGEGGGVDQHGHLGRAALLAAARSGEGGDERIGPQLVPGPCFGVRLGPLRRNHGVQDGGDAGVGLRVDGEMGVAQPGLPVVPPPQEALAADPFPLPQAVISRQAPGEVTDVAFEPVHRRHRRGLHQLGGLLHQLLAHIRLDLTGDPGHRIHMTSGHRPSSERVVQLRHLRAQLTTRSDRVRLPRRAPPTTGHNRRVWAGRSERGVERVEPATHLCRLGSEFGDLGP